MEKNNAPKTLFGWLGFNEHPDYSKHRTLGHFLGWLLQAVVLLLFILDVTVIIQFAAAAFGPVETSHEAIRNIGLVAAAILGVPFLIWRSVVAQKQVDVAEQSHITDRISKAVEQLGSEKVVKRQLKDADGNPVFAEDGVTPKTVETTEPNIEVRMGGIFALERIGKDSPQDHLQIMEILTAYIRENAPAAAAKEPPNLTTRLGFDEEYELRRFYGRHGRYKDWISTLKPNSDIQTIITVLGRRPEKLRQMEVSTSDDGVKRPEFRLDLRNNCLQGVDFSDGNYDFALFDGARAEGSHFYETSVNGTWFYKAVFDGADFSDADIYGATFENTSLRGACFSWLDFEGTRLLGAKFVGSTMLFADLSERVLNGADFTAADTRNLAVKFADLSKANGLSNHQVANMFGDATTRLPTDIAAPDWQGEELSVSEFNERWRAKKAEHFLETKEAAGLS